MSCSSTVGLIKSKMLHLWKFVVGPIQLWEKHAKVARMPYIGIVKRIETADMFQKVKEFVEVHQQLGYRWVHVHASTPCSSGSPLKNFSATIESEADRSWKGIMENVSKYLLLGNSVFRTAPKQQHMETRRDQTSFETMWFAV